MRGTQENIQSQLAVLVVTLLTVQAILLMAKLTKGRGLRRFRAALAEVEEAASVCPECDSILEDIIGLGINKPAVPGDFATLMPYRYCDICQLYYLHGSVTDEG